MREERLISLNRLWLLIPSIFMFSHHFIWSQDLSRSSLKVGHTTNDIVLDGFLNEADWHTADMIEGLTMLEPTEGGSPSNNTQVKVMANSKSIYIGIYCFDDPQNIVSFSKNRDAKLNDEDHIRIVLDPFLDGRTGYIFAINPSGARYDALVARQGEGENSDWDALWEAISIYQPDGWSVEIRIPIESINFKEDIARWGFNIERRIQRYQETDRWSNATQDYQLTQTSRAGILTDLPKFDVGIGLSIRPSITSSVGVSDPEASSEFSLEPSLDFTQRIGTNTTASITVNTDFAETEVDSRRTNLTRFSLFFPEKGASFWKEQTSLSLVWGCVVISFLFLVVA